MRELCDCSGIESSQSKEGLGERVCPAASDGEVIYCFPGWVEDLPRAKTVEEWKNCRRNEVSKVEMFDICGASSLFPLHKAKRVLYQRRIAFGMEAIELLLRARKKAKINMD
ncbi:hypothetical protein Acr_03g0001410 [Actinidia rufa]|uniref:Uncharacterized protein n=1 Tax=Actinidia rufa TaxID=165716 RepID=A0A7J0ECJ2_9ERIC|nr:hypothetical protein Acr_03g0001410 [Actinidia rufa]